MSTMIEAKADYVAKNPDVVQRFVDASIIGWYNYLYGDNKAANDLIKKDNPDMTDDQIAFSIGKIKEYGLVDSGAADQGGIGCLSPTPGRRASTTRWSRRRWSRPASTIKKIVHDRVRLQEGRRRPEEVGSAPGRGPAPEAATAGRRSCSAGQRCMQ